MGLSSKNISALKDCDVRGTYPEEVNEELFEAVGYGFGQCIVDKAKKDSIQDLVILAGDARISTPTLKAQVLKGLRSHPLKILDIGTVPTNIAYWAKEKKNAQAIAIITASHNPPNFNGLKMMNGEFPPTPEEIHSLQKYISHETNINSDSKIEYWLDVVKEYQDEVTQNFNGRVNGLKIVVDPGNGCLAKIASDIYKMLGATVIAINDERDGLFRGRAPDCAVAENLEGLKNAVLKHGADLGIAFDGDGDRLAVVDNLGRVVRIEYVTMLLLRERLKDAPNQTVVLDVKCSSKLEALISNMNCYSIRAKSGHAFMKKEAIERNANLGVELSGHIFLRELNQRDDPLYTSLIFSSLVNNYDGSLSDEIDLLPNIYSTDDIRIKMSSERIREIISMCKSSFEDTVLDSTDGAKVIFENGWVLARMSITEPKITIRIEADTKAGVKEIAYKFSNMFEEFTDLSSNAIVGG